MNPADLSTKHSLSRERLKGLVTLFDCHFRSGRAESAPKMRTGAADKKTISDADLATVGERLIFPHLEYARPLLDRLYPQMAVLEAVDAGGPQQDEGDPILVEGYRLARDLVEACDIQGRKRRLEAYGSDEVKLLGEYPHRTLTLGQVGQQTARSDSLPMSTVIVVDATSLRDPLRASTHPSSLASNRSAARLTARGATRHGPSPLQPQGAFKSKATVAAPGTKDSESNECPSSSLILHRRLRSR